MCAKDIDFDAAQRLIDNARDAYFRREVEDGVAVRNQLLQRTLVSNRGLCKVEQRVILQMRDVPDLSCRQVIENRNRVRLRE
jgi:hypothetical protein